MILQACVAYEQRRIPIDVGVKSLKVNANLGVFEFVAAGVFVPLGQV